jgi:HAMP domain-containing protein
MRKDGTDLGNLGAVPCEPTVDCSIFSSEAHIVPDMANTFHAWKSRCQVDPNTPVKIDTAVYSLVAGAGLVEKFLQFDVVEKFIELQRTVEEIEYGMFNAIIPQVLSAILTSFQLTLHIWIYSSLNNQSFVEPRPMAKPVRNLYVMPN